MLAAVKRSTFANLHLAELWSRVATAAVAVAALTQPVASAAPARPSLSCFFTEPFDTLVVSPETVTWSASGEIEKLQNAKVTAAGTGYTVGGRLASGSFTAKITKERFEGPGETIDPYTIRVAELKVSNNGGMGGCTR
jgi:hypothetical protein